MRHCHEVVFYANDASMIDGFALFIESALQSGHAAIVVVTNAHRVGLLAKLEADGVNAAAATEQGKFILLEAADALSRLTVNDAPDPVRCAKVIGDLIAEAFIPKATEDRPRTKAGDKISTRGRHGFDGSCRGPKACREPTARDRLETRTANNNLALAA